MLHRCIMIFPHFRNAKLIQDIRKKYDPQYHLVAPHITLVFPFYSEITSIDIRDHIINSIDGINAFDLQLCGVTGEDGGYLFLNVYQGREEIVLIHRRLYQGILNKYYPTFLKETKYKPHLTLGKIQSRAQFDVALKEYGSINDLFEDHVEGITVEIIDMEGNSNIEMTIPL